MNYDGGNSALKKFERFFKKQVTIIQKGAKGYSK